MPTLNNSKDLEKYIKLCMKNALECTGEKLRKKLMEFIDQDFYQKYKPKEYIRSYQLKNSPEFISLSNDLIEIFIDTDSMNYKEAEGDWVAQLAAKGYHGGYAIFREGYYWEDFLDYVHSNIIDIYKSELKKQGLSVT